MSATEAASPIPSWMEQPPQYASVSPPVVSLKSELPFQELDWPNFERLCLRLARLDGHVIGARLYGSAGQKQEGIDLYAQLSPSGYRVYQCKRVREWHPNIIQSAVEAFIAGSWRSRAQEFVLCSTDSLRTTQQVEMYEEQRLQLLGMGVTLRLWDREGLSELLRDKPDLVHAFFDQPWVEHFCGRRHADQTRGRLGPKDLSILRAGLGTLYSEVFAAHDPGSIGPEGGEAVPLRGRFTLPDVFEHAEHLLTNDELRPVVADRGEENRADSDTAQTSAGSSRPDLGRLRVPLVGHLAASSIPCSLIVGGPGSGKSSLLRFVALDLLSDGPREYDLTRLWAGRLPIWLPFGAWVERIESSQAVTSPEAVLRDWLGQWSVGDLFPLVEAAIRDKRLLLLVDGLDEWTSEPSARIALNQLRVFAQANSVTVVATARPDGARTLAGELKGWGVAELAPLTAEQQLELARRWFSPLGRPSSPTTTDLESGEGSAVAKRQALEAIEAISRIPDAHSLAEVPLLLCTLLLLRLRDIALPTNRFRAYELLTQQLMLTHPKRRLAASQMIAKSSLRLPDDELDRAYAFLAFKVHQDSKSGLFDSAFGRKHLERVLFDDEFGITYPKEDAARFARTLVDVGEKVSGVLVERSPSKFAFFHRCIQEHLAAHHLATLREEEQLAIVSAHAVEPHWREVILAFASRARSGQLVEKTVAALRATLASAPPVERLRLSELVTEVGVGPGPCPTSLRRSIIDEAALNLETHWCESHRRNLLVTLLSGLGLQSARGHLLPKLEAWFPERLWHRQPVLTSLRNWPSEEAWLHLSYPSDHLS